jgi:hypothetical protein
LHNYYANPRSSSAEYVFVSDYARSHPLEDWAESWAHYLHMMDCLETAYDQNICQINPWEHDFEDCIEGWSNLSVTLNELNRSMGLKDAYPFVLSTGSIRKLHFVHQLVYPSSPTS